MIRERTLKVVLVVVGLLFSATIYPLMRSSSLWQPNQSEDIEPMMLSLYVTLGIFLLIAARNPSANRSVIGFAAWSSIAHATVMTVQAFQNASHRGGLLGASATFVVIGAALIVLAPGKQSVERASAVPVLTA
jgi:triacylglycerol esterase/lipase EstA (alpha/beta hydrolase family)